MEAYDPAEAAQRSGIGIDELNRMVELGNLTPDSDDRFTPGHLRRAAGEVIVSQEVVDASIDSPIAFRDVGPVELKGVSGARRLFAAARE